MSEIRVDYIKADKDSISLAGITTFSGTGTFGLPGGNTSQRPEIPKEGQVRYINGDIKRGIEYYNGTDWITVGTSSDIVTSGLVLHLDAGNTLSYPGTGTTWTDLSGRGNNGTLTNGPTYSSSNGGSIVLDGTNDYINCGDNVNTRINDNVSFSIWLKFPTGYGNSGWNSIVQKRPDNSNENYGMNYNVSSDELQWTFKVLGGGISVSLSSNFSTNTWTNICGVFSKNNTTTDAYLYKNGNLLTSSNIADNVTSYSANLLIGALLVNSATDEVAPITVANCLLHNKALTATEVSQNYNALKSRFGLT